MQADDNIKLLLLWTLRSVSVRLKNIFVEVQRQYGLGTSAFSTKDRKARIEQSCSRTLLEIWMCYKLIALQLLRARGREFLLSWRLSSRPHHIIFRLSRDINLCSDTNEHESTRHNVSLDYAKILMGDLLLRLSMVCGNHRCDELLNILWKSVTWIPEFGIRHKSIQEIRLYFERQFDKNVKRATLSWNVSHLH